MANSRSKNAVLNISVGFGAQILILLLSFIGRKIFVHFLELDYLGINGLYSNILSVLALAELGLGNVTQFFLYKPVVEDNKPLVRYLVKYFGKMYWCIAGTVFLLGVLLMPFLKYFINSDLPQNELLIYYVLFLLNSVVSYFAADKIALLAAYQDNRLQKYILLLTNTLAQVGYIIVLVVWHNYFFYVSVTLLMSILNVALINLICRKKYPFLYEKSKEKPEGFDKRCIIDNVKSTFMYKIGATIVNNTDNILISAMISTAAVGLYSNYQMVVLAIQGFIAIVSTSLISGIGNLSATGNKKRMNSVFNVILLLYHLIAAYGAIAFYFLFQDLISIWLGQKYILDGLTTFAIAFAFYVTNAISPIWMFREANGLFSKVKYLFIFTAVINIIVSIALGNVFGMAGILLATSLARIVTQVWYEPHILCKEVLGISSKPYWKRQVKYMVLTVVAAGICLLLNTVLPHGFGWMVVKAVLFFIVCIIAFGIGVIGTEEFRELKTIGKGAIDKLINR